MVGYGHIAPKTAAGMVVTMLYAIVGIPLTLLTITNLGRMLATAFRFLYRNIFSIICCCCSRPQRPETLPLHVTASTSGRDDGSTPSLLPLRCFIIASVIYDNENQRDEK